jgi:hypothetical protein
LPSIPAARATTAADATNALSNTTRFFIVSHPLSIH